MELPTTGVVCPWEIAIALAEEAVMNGLDLHLEEPVTGILQLHDSFQITTPRGTYEARSVINCAGVYADRIYAMVSTSAFLYRDSRRGEYYVIDKLREKVVRCDLSLTLVGRQGNSCDPTIDGNLLIGPNAWILMTGKESTRPPKLSLVREKIVKTVRIVPFDKIIGSLRSSCQRQRRRFLVEEARRKALYQRGLHRLAGLSSAPAISEYIITAIVSRAFRLSKKNPIRTAARLSARRMTPAERDELVRRDRPLLT
jgi:glycerol-3-phosphate dehydrogenase